MAGAVSLLNSKQTDPPTKRAGREQSEDSPAEDSSPTQSSITSHHGGRATQAVDIEEHNININIIDFKHFAPQNR